MGDPLERILIVAINSDSTKAQELPTEQEYENLLPEQQRSYRILPERAVRSGNSNFTRGIRQH